MADINSTDLFVVNRGDSTYKLPLGDIMAELQDTDLMIVNRSNVTYKVTGEDVKLSLIEPLVVTVALSDTSPIENTPVTAIISTEGGKAPLTITYQWKSKTSAQVIAAISGATSQTLEPPASTVGLQIACEVTAIDSLGTTEVQLSAWSSAVTPFLVAPEITSVTLTEDNPGGLGRFTSQSFDITTAVTEGNPLSLKTFDAYVDGSISVIPETDSITSITSVAGTHPDHWVVVDTQNTGDWRDMEFGNGTFVCCGANPRPGNLMMYSTDYGLNWTEVYLTNGQWQNIAYGNGRFIAVSDVTTHDQIAKSTNNGASWSLSSPSTVWSAKWARICYGDELNNEKFVAIASSNMPSNGSGGYDNSGAIMHGNKSGLYWTLATSVPSGIDGDIYDIVHGVDTYVIVCRSGTNRCAYSTDASTWYLANSGVDNNAQWHAVAYGNGKFVAVATSNAATPSNQIMYSDDGIDWTSMEAPANNAWGDICFDKTSKMFIAMVVGGYSSDDETNQQIMYSYDGINWILTTTPKGGQYWRAIASGDGKSACVANLHYPYTSNQSLLTMVSDGPDTRLTFASDKDLDMFDESSQVRSEPNAAIGMVHEIDATVSYTMNLADNIGTWEVGSTVLGPSKIVNNKRMYLEFDGSGNVSSLLHSSQSPPYTTVDANPTLELTFPATFPSLNTPDEVLTSGVTLTASVTASNVAGSDGPDTATVLAT